MLYKGKSSLFYIFSSFGGALLIAATFAYDNYRFSKYKFIDFSKTILYEKTNLFVPQKNYYYFLIFSSKMDNVSNLINKLPKKYPIITLDIYGKVYSNKKGIIFVRAGTNTIIKIIRKFNIKKVPCYFGLKKYDKKLYKQDTNIKIIGGLND